MDSSGNIRGLVTGPVAICRQSPDKSHRWSVKLTEGRKEAKDKKEKKDWLFVMTDCISHSISGILPTPKLLLTSPYSQLCKLAFIFIFSRGRLTNTLVHYFSFNIPSISLPVKSRP